jgi:hypothetical protein
LIVIPSPRLLKIQDSSTKEFIFGLPSVLLGLEKEASIQRNFHKKKQKKKINL